MLKQTITDLLAKAIAAAQAAGKLPDIAIPEIVIEHPQNPDHGDYSSSISLKLAKAAKNKPLNIANDIVGFIAPSPAIDKVDVAPPGFINFTLKKEWLSQQVEAILAGGAAYSHT